MQADVLGKTVVSMAADEGPAYGVALLAAVGAGEFKDIAEACDATVKTIGQTKPAAAARRYVRQSVSALSAALSVAARRLQENRRIKLIACRSGEPEMGKLNSLAIAVGVLILVIGCKPSPLPPKVANSEYGKIELGMSLDDAKALVNGGGEERSIDNLPVSPKPREIYPNLPANIEWRVWAAAGKPTLILGVVGGKIAFKQVVWNEGGELKSDTNALPEFQ